MSVPRSLVARSPSIRAPLALAGLLCLPLAAQSTRLNGLLAPGRGSLAAFRMAPDGSTAVYSAQQDSEAFDLYRVALAGGPSTRLNTPSADSLLDPHRFEITPDSAHVVFFTTTGLRRDLFAAPLAGGPAIELDDRPWTDGRLVDSRVALTPDGQRVLYVVSNDLGQRALASVSIVGGTPVFLAGPGAAGLPLVSPDSAQAVFLAALDVPGRLEVYRVPVDGSAPPVRLSPPPTRNGFASSLVLSPDGQRVVFTSTLDTNRPVVYSVPVDGGPAVALDPASNTNVSPIPVLTADGARVLFQDGVGLALLSSPIDGGVPAVPLAPSLRINSFQSSPDGSRVVLVENASSAGARLFSVPAAGGTLVQLSPPGVVAGTSFHFTPDSAHVLYAARPEGASAANLYRVPIAGGPSVELHAGLRSPGWTLAPDGTRVALEDQDTFDTLSVPVDGGPAAVLFPSTTGLAFTPDSQSLLLVGRLEFWEPYNLYRTAAAGRGRLVQLNGALAELPSGQGVGRFELLPSEKRVLYLAREDAPAAELLHSVEASGLDRGRLAPPASGGWEWVPSFRTTPDGARALFLHLGPEGYALHVARTEGGYERRLTPFLPTLPGHFFPGFDNVPYAAAPGSRAAAFAADLEQDGQHDLYRVRLRSGAPRRMNPALVPGGNVRTFAFAPAGGRIVYRADQEVVERVELYSVLAGIGPASAVKLSAPLDASSDVEGFKIDPTGVRVVYRTEGTRGLFVAPTDGLAPATEILLGDGTSASLFADLYQLSSDGARVVFPAAAGLHSAPLAGGATVELGADLAALQVTTFALAPDASRVAFSARTTPLDSGLYTTPLGGGPSTLIAPDGGGARFTHGSDRLLYLVPSSSGASLFVAPAAGGPSVLVSGALPVVEFALRADDQLVGFRTATTLYVARLDGQGAPQRVNELEAVVEDFALGAERIFYRAGPHPGPTLLELYSRSYASLP
ncbi:MAG TPA: hypothetical protein VF530_23075 [Planctomycetota bacterium]